MTNAVRGRIRRRKNGHGASLLHSPENFLKIQRNFRAVLARTLCLLRMLSHTGRIFLFPDAQQKAYHSSDLSVSHERGTRPGDEAKPEGTGLRPCPFVILEGSDKPGK